MLCIGGLFASTLLESCASNYYATARLNSNQLIISKSEFVEIKDSISKLRKYVLVRNEKLTFPICLFKLNDAAYSAVLMECTHKSCELNPQGDFLICPCHGSEFDHLGKVQNPPAEIDLQTFKVTHDNENIYIQLS